MGSVAGQEPDWAKLSLFGDKGFGRPPILESVEFQCIAVEKEGIKQGSGRQHTWKHVATEIRDPFGRNVVEHLGFEDIDAGVDVAAEDLLRSGFLEETLNAAVIIETNEAAGPWIFDPTDGHGSHTVTPRIKLNDVVQAARALTVRVDNEKSPLPQRPIWPDGERLMFPAVRSLESTRCAYPALTVPKIVNNKDAAISRMPTECNLSIQCSSSGLPSNRSMHLGRGISQRP